MKQCCTHVHHAPGAAVRFSPGITEDTGILTREVHTPPGAPIPTISKQMALQDEQGSIRLSEV